MARTIKEPAVRRTEILDAAQRLIETKGYEQMMIQDILDELNLSKGGFYHYFGSKMALLTALIERMQDGMAQSLLALVRDPYLSPLSKLQQFFATLLRWKAGQKGFFLALLRAWYTDDNAVVRQKVQATVFQQLAPPLEEIIHQGIQQGVLSIHSADQMGRIVIALTQDLSDLLAQWLLTEGPPEANIQRIQHTVAIYTGAIERVLGAPSDSLQIFDLRTLSNWSETSNDTVSQQVSGKEGHE